MPIENLSKIRFQCRRGMSELEEILYPFFDNYFTQLNEDRQQDFIHLLTLEDTELWDWLVVQQTKPSLKYEEIVRIIRDAT